MSMTKIIFVLSALLLLQAQDNAVSACAMTTARSRHDSVVLQARKESEDGRLWSRRDTILTSSGLVLLQSIWIGSTSTTAALALTTTASSPARVQEWPSLEYLEPLWELQLSVQAVAMTVKDSTKWPFLQKRLDRFFSGGLFSERNYYAGLSFQYTSKIKYSNSELQEYIRLDQENRREAMALALTSLESLRTNLGTGNQDAIEADAKQAQAALGRWFALVPPSDVQAVEALYKAVRTADIDQDGRLSPEELQTLSPTDQDVWKKRVELVGD